MIQMRIFDPRSLGSRQIKRIDESILDKDSSVYLIYPDPTDLGSLILIQIIPKESTQNNLNSCNRHYDPDLIMI